MSVNDHLAAMRAAGRARDIKKKGAAGELAALDIVHTYRAVRGGLLKQGFTYPYASNRQGKTYLGNIFWDEEAGRFYDLTRQLNDEIDILYISNYRIFPIEVKSYHDSTMVVEHGWLYRQGRRVEKSPYAQAEKHARHLYHQLYDVIPDGDPRYIIPMVCFVDACRVDDKRSPEMQYYLPTVPLSSLKTVLMDRDTPVGEYTLDLSTIEKKLKSIEQEQINKE